MEIPEHTGWLVTVAEDGFELGEPTYFAGYGAWDACYTAMSQFGWRGPVTWDGEARTLTMRHEDDDSLVWHFHAQQKATRPPKESQVTNPQPKEKAE